MRHRMKRNTDRRRSAKNLKPLSPGDTVWIPEREAGGTVENLALDIILSRQRMEHSEGIADLILMPNTAEPQSNTNSESNETEQRSSSRESEFN